MSAPAASSIPRMCPTAQVTQKSCTGSGGKGITQREAEDMLHDRTVFGALMVRRGEADALIGGLTKHYPDTIRPALQVISVRPGLRKVSGIYVLITPRGDIYFLADATVNIEPTSEDLAEIALC